MADCKSCAIPLNINQRLERWSDDKAQADITYYRRMVGSLMFLMIGTWPDIAATIGIVSQFAADPTMKHIQAVKWMLRYVKGTKAYKLHLGGQTLKIIGYSDANWGNDVSTQKSTSGTCSIWVMEPSAGRAYVKQPLHCHLPKLNL